MRLAAIVRMVYLQVDMLHPSRKELECSRLQKIGSPPYFSAGFEPSISQSTTEGFDFATSDTADRKPQKDDRSEITTSSPAQVLLILFK